MTASDIGVTNILSSVGERKNPWPVLCEKPPLQMQDGVGWLSDAAFSPVQYDDNPPGEKIPVASCSLGWLQKPGDSRGSRPGRNTVGTTCSLFLIFIFV